VVRGPQCEKLWIRQWRVSLWTESNSGWGPSVRFSEHDNELVTVSSKMIQTINATWPVYSRYPVLISAGTQSIATVFLVVSALNSSSQMSAEYAYCKLGYGHFHILSNSLLSVIQTHDASNIDYRQRRQFVDLPFRSFSSPYLFYLIFYFIFRTYCLSPLTCHISCLSLCINGKLFLISSGVPRGRGCLGGLTPHNSKVLAKTIRIPCSVENTSVTT
jgi:hypothetical protein